MSSDSARFSREARRAQRSLIAFASVVSVVLIVVSLVAAGLLFSDDAFVRIRENVVELNETRATVADPSADAALVSAQDMLRLAANARGVLPIILIGVLCVLGVAAVWTMAAYLYASVIHPFMRLERFAEEVSRGNLDMPLVYERANPFGRFTWAFDNMRKELKRARAAEALALEQNKTMAAVLSHDVKTPIASIRAYSEALGLGVARTEEERAEYARTIMRKCDEVAQLTDDLFLHALADLDRIAVVCERGPIHEVLRQAVADFDAQGRVRLGRVDEAMALIDAKRLEQVLENLLANARKYAPESPVEVQGVCMPEQGAYRITVRDFGAGMPPEDIPFAFDRFYRGSNTQDTPGAGLGLFIVKHLVEQMSGSAHVENAAPGLTVTLEIPLEP